VRQPIDAEHNILAGSAETHSPSVVVLGGGLSGMAAALTLAQGGLTDVTLIERGSALGGLAGSFERDGHFYPLGYHQILHRDRTLLYFLELIGALPSVRWRSIRMLFHVGGEGYDLGTLRGFLRYPMSLPDKLRFARLMLTAFGRKDWSAWADRSAAELVDRFAGAGVRRSIFEPLTQLKFELPCDEVSGAWLGARLHYREGSAPFGYIPDANWTKVLCDGVARLLEDSGVRVRLDTRVARLEARGGRVIAAELEGGERIAADAFISTVPAEVYLGLVPEDRTPTLGDIRYSALLSVVCATRQALPFKAYWTNLASLDRTAGAIFLLTELNPTIGRPGDTCVNFVTHLRGRDRPLFQVDDATLMARYRDDFKAVFGLELDPFWTHIARVPMYSPVFGRRYRNPPMQSATWSNVWFAGNYRTFPSITSTGTALGSGVETGTALLAGLGRRAEVGDAIARFKLKAMPRG
jgi:protoporphyrinogen oxidase